MKKYNKITPEGTRDLLFEECLARRTVEKTLSQVFVSHGFHEVVTPGLEFYDVFDPEYSGIAQEIMYKMTDQQGRLVVMRPDATMPIARLTATRLQKLPKPVRLFYTQSIYRSNPNLMGRSDETMQTGIELLGAGGKRSDLEVIVTAIQALAKCVPEFRLEIGHAGFFQALAEQLPVTDDVREDIRRSIEAKNYPSLNKILDSLEQTPAVAAMRRLPRLFGGEEVFEEAKALCVGRAGESLSYLQEIYNAISVLGMGDRVIVDLGLVQRNDYYTGIIFSAYIEEYGEAVLIGGRYDNLLAFFDSPMPAIGFGINVDAIANVLLKQEKIAPPAPADVLVHSESGAEVKALLYAAKLAEEGKKCENSILETVELAVAYAKERGIPRVDIVGEKIQTIACQGEDERA